MPVYNSLDNQLVSADTFGMYRRFYTQLTTSTTTLGTTTSGYNIGQRYSATINMPSSFGQGVNGLYLTRIDMVNEDISTSHICGIEYLLGTLTVSGNSFSAGSAMPLKSMFGESIQTATEISFMEIDTTLTATNPVVTVTYTNQDGDTGKTAALTLPSSSSADSAFMIDPHFASGDTGIREVTNISISTGTGGVIKIHGLLVLQQTAHAIAGLMTRIQPSCYPINPWIVQASEKIAFYRLGLQNSSQFYAVLAGVANYE